MTNLASIFGTLEEAKSFISTPMHIAVNQWEKTILIKVHGRTVETVTYEFVEDCPRQFLDLVLEIYELLD
jgi:hypothetical protein